MENFKSFPVALATWGKSTGGPSKRAFCKAFVGEAGILLARGGTPAGPHSTWNFTVISVRKKVICLFSIIGSGNSTLARDSRRDRNAGRAAIALDVPYWESGQRGIEKMAGNPEAPA